MTETILPGSYECIFEANASSIATGSLLRKGFGLFEVISEDFFISGFEGTDGVDDDGNGLFDRFEVSLQVTATRFGEVRVIAMLRNGVGSPVPVSAVTHFQQPGTQEIVLSVPAEIFARNGSGQYVLQDVMVFDVLTESSKSTYPNIALGNLESADFETMPEPLLDAAILDSNSGLIEGGNRVFLSGQNLVDVIRVTVNGVDALFTAGAPEGLAFRAPSRGPLPNELDLLKVDIIVSTAWGEATLEDGYTYLRGSTVTPGSGSGDDDDGGGGGGCSSVMPLGPTSWRNILGGGGWLAALVLVLFVRARRARTPITSQA